MMQSRIALLRVALVTRMRSLPTLVRRLGWPGALGAIAVLLGLWGQHAYLPSLQSQTLQAEQDGRRLRHELQVRLDQQQILARQRARAGVTLDPNAGPREVWMSLWQQLPQASQRVAMQHAVLASARQAGVTLNSVALHGELQPWVGASDDKAAAGTQARAGRGLWREQMQMPVQVSYPVLRKWIESLQRQPALTLDALDIQRSDPMSDIVKAQLTLSLWWRVESEAPSP